jgi:uncharacterized protein with HEPN domain
MYDKELILSLLQKIEFTIGRILSKADSIKTPDDYALNSWGMERLESTCMLLITIGEGIKNIDKITSKKLLTNYPEIDWQGIMKMRDIIAHHYFDIDAEVVFDVVKNKLPELYPIIQKMILQIK